MGISFDRAMELAEATLGSMPKNIDLELDALSSCETEEEAQGFGSFLLKRYTLDEIRAAVDRKLERIRFMNQIFGGRR